ncbi:MAG: HPr family phosphocarrier protein [Filifactoraceae bacterium]
MESKVFVVKNITGLHARPAAQLVQVCSKFQSEVMIKKGNSMIDGKSIIGVMGLGVAYGNEFEVIVDGSDEEKAMKMISEFIDSSL